MSAVARSQWHLSVDEYLAAEEHSEVRHEYVNGEVYALAGASLRHGQIVGNIHATVWNGLRGRSCKTVTNDMKVQVSSSVIYYPAVVVTCDPDDLGPLVIRHPVFIAEVLSPSTASTDRREKAMLYLRMPSLLCYMIVYQDAKCVELHWRPDSDSEWRFELVIGRSVEIPGLELKLSIDQIYEGVDIGAADSSA